MRAERFLLKDKTSIDLTDSNRVSLSPEVPERHHPNFIGQDSASDGKISTRDRETERQRPM